MMLAETATSRSEGTRLQPPRLAKIAVDWTRHRPSAACALSMHSLAYRTTFRSPTRYIIGSVATATSLRFLGVTFCPDSTIGRSVSTNLIGRNTTVSAISFRQSNCSVFGKPERRWRGYAATREVKRSVKVI